MPIKDNPGMRRTRPTLPRSGKSASAVLVRQLRSLAQFGEQADRNRTSAHLGPGTALRAHGTAEDQYVVVEM